MVTRRQHGRLQLPRDPAAARVGHAAHRARGLRHPLGLLRRRRAARGAALGRARSGELEGARRRHGRLQRLRCCVARAPDDCARRARSCSSSPASASRSGRRTRARSSSCGRRTICAAASSASTSGPSPALAPLGGLLAGWLCDVGGTRAQLRRGRRDRPADGRRRSAASSAYDGLLLWRDLGLPAAAGRPALPATPLVVVARSSSDGTGAGPKTAGRVALGGAAGAEATGQAAQTHAASAIPARIIPGQTSRSSHAVRMAHLCSEAGTGQTAVLQAPNVRGTTR